MHILQSLQGHLHVAQSLISFLNNNNDVAFSIALETNYLIFGARDDMVSVPKYTGRMYLLFRIKSFLRLYLSYIYILYDVRLYIYIYLS